MKTNEISIKPFSQALETLSTICKEKKTEYIRDATIQRFEYTFELAWKLLKRYIESEQNTIEVNIKNIFRDAAKLGLIESFENWDGYLKARNQTSHTYAVNTAEQVYDQALKFEKSARFMKKKLEKLLG